MSDQADEALIDAAFAKDDKHVPPEELASERAGLVTQYAEDHMLTPLLQIMLHKLLKAKPEDPVAHLAHMLRTWRETMVVVVGPPASGKRTLGEKLAQRLGLQQVSPADLVRGLAGTNTSLGNSLQSMSESSEGVPDDFIEDLILQRLQEQDCTDKGWVLDGWPRTAEQAERMVAVGLAPMYAVIIDVPDDEVLLNPPQP
ncbi:adenylate kinase-domain-containing protein [Baffinella frigidus]|nr:adenylate kinase-domain-containing protein [Cryptophyta sp. CCMP2293]